MSEDTSSPSAWQTYKRLMVYVKPYWYGWVLAIVGFGIAALSQLAWAELLEYLLKIVDNKMYEKRWLVAAAIISIFIVRGLSTFVAQYAMSFVSVRVVAALRHDIFRKLLYLPYSFHQKQSAGRVLTLVTYNTEQLSGATTEAVKTLLQEGLLAISLLGYLLYVNWQLTLLFLCLTPLIGWLVSSVARRLKMLSSRIQRSMGDVAQVTADTVKGFQIIKSFQGEKLELSRFDAANQNSVRQNLKHAVTSGIATPVIQTLVGIQMAALVAFALSPEFMGEVGAPQFMAYITAAGLLVKPAKSLSNINGILMRGVAAAEELFQIMDLKTEESLMKTVPEEQVQNMHSDTAQSPALTGNSKSMGTQEKPVDGSVEFNQVRFRYDEGLPLVFNRLNLKIKSGEMVALVGKTGSGKTTITDLLMGFFPLESGDIKVGQSSIQSMDLDALRANIALVPQFSELFEGSIRDNIAYGALQGASDEDVRQAADMAHALEFIERLPEGFNTPLGENGIKLSGGQRQRLAIARAILKKAPIIVMDEATSALDNQSERYIQAAMQSLRGQMTMIVIAHRLSTIEQADRIMVLDTGEVIETGSHAELLEMKGAYAQLYSAQLSSGSE